MTNLNRREFIAAGSAAVAGLAVSSGRAFAAEPAAATSPLSLFVGYWGGAPRIMRRFITNAPATLDSAQSVLTGDPSLFSLGARISFRGLHRQQGSAPRSILIDAMQRTNEGARLPFFAFTHVEDRTGIRTSPPLSFTMNVQTEGTLDLVVRSTEATTSERTLSFAVNSADGALMLNRGVYVLALTNREPHWRAIRFADGARPDAFVTGKQLLASAMDGQPVDFDYVVMTVGAASSPKE